MGQHRQEYTYDYPRLPSFRRRSRAHRRFYLVQRFFPRGRRDYINSGSLILILARSLRSPPSDTLSFPYTLYITNLNVVAPSFVFR